MIAMRGQYLHCIAYPPQWELKRGLADRYAKLGVYGSAAEAYLELEQWDEVVQCYRALDRLGRAEAIVRERLQVRGRCTGRPQRHRREGTQALMTGFGSLIRPTPVLDLLVLLTWRCLVLGLTCRLCGMQVEETPAMWAALGDLTQDAECYHKAWELSKGRYARAKRSLGRMAFRNKK